jgi:predicted dehydrogenase
MTAKNYKRRKFIKNIGSAGLALSLLPALNACNIKSKNETNMNNDKKKLGIALVGLGYYSTGQLAPALLQTEHCYLAGIVTGSPHKAAKYKAEYNIADKNIYNYENFDSIKDNPDIDIVYVVLPNSMHKEYTVRAAQAGKHVICEKPMAITVEECDAMIKACKDAGKKLSIGYRLHFDPYNLEMMKYGREKTFGEIKKIDAGFGFTIGGPQWRLSKTLAGGGPLMDVGIYAIQGICYTIGKDPISVIAKEDKKTDLIKFNEVEQSLSWQFEFDGGLLATGKTSYAENFEYLHVEAEKGTFGLEPAYIYNGLQGYNPNGKITFAPMNQQAAQMDDFAICIKEDRQSIVSGEMGRRDVKYLQAIYESAKTGNKILLN